VGDNDDGQPHRGGETVSSGSKDEGYLYWLAHVVNNGVSLHSTSDAEGPVRRGSFSINCTTAVVLLEALFIGQLGPTGQGTLEGIIAGGDENVLIDLLNAQPGLGETLAPVISAVLGACPQIFDPAAGGGGLPLPLGAGAGGAARRGEGDAPTDAQPAPEAGGAPDTNGAPNTEAAPEARSAPEDAPPATDQGDQEGSG
jgi:hypothetical protein